MGRIAHPHPPIRLRELRLAANIGVKELARQASVPAWVIYQTEHRSCNPLLHKPTFKKVAKVLNTSLAELLKPAENWQPPTKEHPVQTGDRYLPAVVKKRKPPAAVADVAPRRGRPPAPAAQGDTVELSIVRGGVLLGGITTNDLKSMRAVLKDIFGDDDAG